MGKKIFELADKIIKKVFYLLFFLVPLILTPWNFELFEFNKMILVYLLTTIIIMAWFLKMIVAKTFIFKRSFWDLPLLLFLFSQVASTIFSLNRHTSIWGYYTRAHGGLLSTICYLLLYWAFVSNMPKVTILSEFGSALRRSRSLKNKLPQKRKMRHHGILIRALLLSAFLVAGYGILEHFGIDKNYWVQDVQNRVFSTLGQPNWLAAYLVALIFLPMAMALRKTKNQKLKTKNTLFLIPYSLFIIFYLCLLFTKSRSGLLGFGVAYAIFWGLTLLPQLKKKTAPVAKVVLKKFLIFTSLILLLSLTINNPIREQVLVKLKIKTPPLSPIPPGVVIVMESGEIRKIVWQGALRIWRHYLLFGSGTETFAYSYYNFRPVEHNLASEWDFLYNKAHNEYLNYLANSGIFGLGSYLLLIGSFIIWSLRESEIRSKKNHNSLSVIRNSLLAGFASILITNFFGFSVVVIGLLFFLFPAISFVLSKQEKEVKIKIPKKFSKPQLLLAATVLSFSLFALSFTLRIWYADVLYAQAENFHSHDLHQQAFEAIQKATHLNPREPVYDDKMSLISANLAQLAFDQEESTLSAQLTQLAIKKSDQALKSNPYHLNFWKNRTRTFLILSEINPDFKLQALEALIQAGQLAPTDAKIFYNLALLYRQLDQKQLAVETLKKTIQMKTNYKQARFALALYLQEDGKTKEAVEELEYIINSIDPLDEGIKDLIKDWQ